MSQETTKQNKKPLVLVLALVVLAAIIGICYWQFGPKAQKGAKALTVEVVNDQGEKKEYKTNTDAEYLRQALEEIKDLKIEGSESQYGLMVETVNGLTADYSKDGAYWAFYVNGDYCQNGVDTQPVADGETYSIVYTK